MKTSIAVLAAVVALGSAAQAADLPSTQEPVFAPTPAPLPAFTWTGAYGGVNLGFGWGDFTGEAGPLSDSAEGFLGGVQGGYNFQFDQFVVGAEADFQLSDVNARVNGGGRLRLENFGTLRARVGFAADRFLPYLTAGYAFGNTKSSVGGFTDNEFHHGWTAGAGVEYAWSDNITTKLEGLYVDLEKQNFNVGVPGGVDGGLGFGLARAGLNFKF